MTIISKNIKELSGFESWRNMEKIIIPTGASEIGAHTFHGYWGLEEVTLSTGITKIGFQAFRLCRSLEQITLSADLIEIGPEAFSSCSHMSHIVLPDSLISIGYGAFEYCRALNQITLSAGLIEIGSEAFRACDCLEQIELPAGLTKIGNAAFITCKVLKQITIPVGITEIANGTFIGCLTLKQITIPISVTKIGRDAFRACRSLEQIMLPAGLTELGGYAFWDCSALTQIIIPAGVTKIDEYVFWECFALEQITLPAGITEVAWSAFEDCSALARIIINTNSDDELERVKKLFLSRLRHKIIKQSVYHQAMKSLGELSELFIKPMQGEHSVFYAALIAHALRFNDKKLDLPYVLTNIVASFEERCYMSFKKQVREIPIPINEEGLEAYKRSCKEVCAKGTRSDNEINNEAHLLLSQVTMNAISCKEKLTTYWLYIKKQKIIKQQKQPYFFRLHILLSLNITAKLKAVKKAIDFLGGNNDITFTLKDMALLDEGFTGNCLKSYNVSLPQDVNEHGCGCVVS